MWNNTDMEQQTWAGAARGMWHTAVQHKFIAGLIAVCVAASLVAIALVASDSRAPAGPAADPAAPAFSLPVLNQSGQKVSLSDYAGRPLIVNFFASWCEPCQKETPLLATVWGYDFDPGSNVVDVCVRRLRSKLGFDLIKTVRGEGYRLAS